ncbi:MAG: YkvA family protein [Negativicutes bacterium]|nr:YkvA family protein [Negativicutes bacterium]
MAISGAFRVWGFFKTIKNDALLLYYAWKHPSTPPVIKGMLVALVAYVLSPVDFIPDYLPFIGIADDVAIIPAAVLFLTNMLPSSIRTECEKESRTWRKRIPWVFAVFILFILMWLGIAIVGLSQVIQWLV